MEYAFITLITLIASTAFAHTEGFGEGALTDPPKAICRLTYKDTPFCSGTIVKSSAFDEPKFVSAGHCFDAFKNNPQEQTLIKAECGCRKNGCLETFFIKDLDYSETVSGNGDFLTDYAIASLDHTPSDINPIELSAPENFINTTKNELLSGASCVFGGFGDGRDLKMTTTPNVFPTTCDIGLSENGEENKKFLIYTSISISESNLLKFKDLKTDDALIKKLKEENMIRYNEYQLVQMGYLPNITLSGDSGSGLLCKYNSEHYKLIGTLSGSDYKGFTVTTGKKRRPVKTNYYSLQNYFSPTQPEWLKEKNSSATHTSSE